MSQEIIYTSAPKGLKSGSRGFCTVVSTAGMAKNLADRLETLSGYRHQSMPHESGENPVNYSHLRLIVGGKKYHVLSRICDAGMDYTKRTNKLAHHIAVTTSETAKSPGGPAWAISQHDFLVEVWDGEVKTVPESQRRLTSKPCPIGRCSTWESQSVDPGWAGTLAETAVTKAQPMSVIFKEGADTRAMVREALALVPPEKRWDTTFTTYFTKLPAGVDCLWRFVLDGTPEATALRRNPHARVIDLCDPSLGRAPDSDFAEFARSGKAAQPAAPQPSAAAAGSRRTPGTPPAAIAPTGQPWGGAVPTPPPGNAGAVQLLPQVQRADANFSSNRSSNLKTIGLVCALCLFVVIGMVGAYMAGTRSVADIGSTNVPDAPEIKPTAPDPKVEPPEEMEQYDPLDSLSPEARQQVKDAEAANEETERMKQEEEKERQHQEEKEASQRSAEKESSDMPTEEPDRQDHKPFDNILERDRMLRLPPRPTKGVGGGATLTFQELAKLYVNNLAECDIKLRGEEVEEQGGRTVVIERDPKEGVPSNGVVTWNVIPKFRNTLGQPKPTGTFQLKDNSFQFQWSRDPKLDLHLCLLEITVGDKTQTCSLVNPKEVKAIQVDFDEKEQNIDLGLSDSSKLKLDLWVEGEELGEVEVRDGRAVKRGSKATIRIPDPNGIGESKHVQIQVEFLVAGNNHDLRLQAYGFPKFVTQPTNVKNLVAKYKEEREPEQIRTAQRRSPLNNMELMKWQHACKVAQEELKKAKDRQVSLLETLKTKGKFEHDSRMATLKSTLNAGNLPESQKQKRIDNAEKEYQRRLDWRMKEGVRLEEYGELVTENEQWCNSMETLLKKIHDNGRVHFRVYVKADDRELPLVLSR